MIDVVQLVRDNKARYEWHTIYSEAKGYKLYLNVLRDAMRFDGIPACTWKREIVPSTHPDFGQTFDGVRLPATAHELQQIADMIGAMLLTPKVIDLLWLQAGLKFGAVINTPYPSAKKPTIVATSDIHRVHQEIEKKIAALGGDDGTQLIECVGKYWSLIQEITNLKVQGDWAACNYGWFDTVASGPGLTPGTHCWQRPGTAHNKRHWDPSQTIRVMHKVGRLVHPDGMEEEVLLPDIAQIPLLCSLLVHTGKPLTYLRQQGVPEEARLGFVTLPSIVV
jgi:hypothetical protein